MTQEERSFALAQLERGAATLREALQGLTEEEASQRSGGGWSVLDCVEHVAVTEQLLLPLLRAGCPDLTRGRADDTKDEAFAAAVVSRRRKVEAPAPVVPALRFATLAEGMEAFHRARQETLAWLQDCTDDLRSLWTPHPVLGVIDCYRCLILAAMHPARHAAQIREIRSAATGPS